MIYQRKPIQFVNDAAARGFAVVILVGKHFCEVWYYRRDKNKKCINVMRQYFIALKFLWCGTVSVNEIFSLE